MVRPFNLGSYRVDGSSSPLIVAEMSGNHNQSIQRALEIVDAAAGAGAQALKLQTYTAETITLKLAEREFLISNPVSPWSGKSLHELYEEAHTPWSWHESIFRRAVELGMIPFSTPFDETAVDFLESLHAPFYKIASFEITHLPLLRKVASTGKPILISTGMATVAEIGQAVSVIREAGCGDVLLLKCTSSYPASSQNTNLRTLPHLRELLNCPVGLSDHTLGIGVAVASVAFGASVIEKHFTLRRSDGGVDAAFSLEPQEMSLLVSESRRAWDALGTVVYGPTGEEKPNKMFRRSIYVSEDIPAGGLLTRQNIRIIRPGLGLEPKYLDLVLGKKTPRPVTKGTPVDWNLFT